MKTPQSKTLFLAWQDSNSRAWFPIGRLKFADEKYHFIYIKGVEEAQKKSNFTPLSCFPELNKVYTSTQLFSVFANRLMSPSRPDYPNFIQWLNLKEQDPMTILSRSIGQRKTDTLSIFSFPELDITGQYKLHFFSHGVRHLPECAIERINNLQSGEKLWLSHEFQNSYDAQALTLNTEDHYIVGYCPRYLGSEIFQLIRQNPNLVTVEVERVNLPPTPLQFRLLCQITTLCPDNYIPFSSVEYQPLIEEYSEVMQ